MKEMHIIFIKRPVGINNAEVSAIFTSMGLKFVVDDKEVQVNIAGLHASEIFLIGVEFNIAVTRYHLSSIPTRNT